MLEVDAKFTHPSPLVHDAQFILALSVNYLLNNIDYEDRAQAVFDEALMMSKRSELVYSDAYISTWLEQAEELAKRARSASSQQ